MALTRASEQSLALNFPPAEGSLPSAVTLSHRLFITSFTVSLCELSLASLSIKVSLALSSFWELHPCLDQGSLPHIPQLPHVLMS